MDEEELSTLDKYISRYIEVKTPREIAELAGTTPERVISRAEAMKDEVDALSIDAKLYFAITRLNQIAMDAQNDAANAADARDKGGLYSAAVGAIRETLKQYNILKKENESAVLELNRKRVQELLRLFDVVIDRGVQEVAEVHGIDRTELLATFQTKIVEAAKELESR